MLAPDQSECSSSWFKKKKKGIVQCKVSFGQQFRHGNSDGYEVVQRLCFHNTACISKIQQAQCSGVFIYALSRSYMM